MHAGTLACTPPYPHDTTPHQTRPDQTTPQHTTPHVELRHSPLHCIIFLYIPSNAFRYTCSHSLHSASFHYILMRSVTFHSINFHCMHVQSVTLHRLPVQSNIFHHSPLLHYIDSIRWNSIPCGSRTFLFLKCSLTFHFLTWQIHLQAFVYTPFCSIPLLLDIVNITSPCSTLRACVQTCLPAYLQTFNRIWGLLAGRSVARGLSQGGFSEFPMQKRECFAISSYVIYYFCLFRTR